MIISEKQIMQLIACAHNLIELSQFIMNNTELEYTASIVEVKKLLGQINTQQSEELKEIK